eukprot:XP_011663532.1 PREDICTED: zinc finger protein 862-like [Strongylocentrotus purpuratus]
MTKSASKHDDDGSTPPPLAASSSATSSQQPQMTKSASQQRDDGASPPLAASSSATSSQQPQMTKSASKHDDDGSTPPPLAASSSATSFQQPQMTKSASKHDDDGSTPPPLAASSSATSSQQPQMIKSLSHPHDDCASSHSANATRRTKSSTVDSWGYDWLKYNEHNGYVSKVWCSVCRNARHRGTKVSMHPGQAQICDNDAYIVGTSNVKKDTSKSHSRSKFHLSAVQATLPLVEKSKLAQQFQTMQDRTKAKMSKLFDIAYMVAHCEQPFTMYKQFVLLEKKHGVDLGVTYINDAACRTFIHHIAATMREDLEKLFGQEPFYFSLLFDGSTDKSISEKEVVSIKLIEDGIPKIKVLGIAEPERCDAATVEQAIRKLCEDHNLNLKNGFVASAADGAAVNFGERSGILTRFQQEDAPWLIKMHCIAHRLELALKDAFKNTYYVLIDELMMQMYYIYRRSAKKWREVKAVASALNKHVVKPSRSQGTRWVDHRRKALKCLATNYHCIVSQFEEQASGQRKDISPADAAKMKGFLKMLKSSKLHMSSYRDMVEYLAELSLGFQRDDLPVSSVGRNILVAQAGLKRMEEKPGPHLRTVLAAATEAVNEEEAEESPTFSFQDVKLKVTKKDVVDFQASKVKVLKSVSTCLETRLADFGDDPIIKAAKILDPIGYPSDVQEAVDFGIDEIHTLCDHFRPLLMAKGCEVELVEVEWMKLRQEAKKEKFQDLWKNVLVHQGDVYPNLCHIIRILLVLPTSTAQVERQFSTIKRCQGDWRLSLSTATITDLLRISNEGPAPEEYNPEAAVQHWFVTSNASRRPSVQPYGSRVTTPQATDWSASESDGSSD